MRLLLDTHAFMWALSEPHKLSAKVNNLLVSPANVTFVSIISLWEIITKRQIGKLNFGVDLEAVFVEQSKTNDFRLLGFDLHHLREIETLPLHHRDPFDRALIAQAIADNLTLVTRDSAFTPYPVSTLW